MRWVVASGLFSCVLVAGLLALGAEDTSSPGTRSSASAKFLTRALGETRPGAPLVRRPTPGVRVRVDRSGFQVSGRGAAISLASPGGRSWNRFAGGLARPTAFGRQTILVRHDKAEEFLTVARRQGPRTWRWQLAAGGLTPRLGDDGAIGFVDGHALAALHIEPVAILDADGEDVTPDDLRWSLERRGGAWLLALRLDDSELPLPYVIDPAIAFRSATTAVNLSTAFVTITKPVGVVQNDLLLAHLNFESGSALVITPPSGWTLVRRTNNLTDIGQAVYRKVAGASEPVSYMFNFDTAKKASAGMSAYTNVSTTSPVNVSGGATGNSATPTAPSVTTTVANTMLVALFGNKKTSTYTPPAGMTERYDVANIAGGMPSSAAADEARAATGATGTRQATSSDPEAWVAQLVALRVADTTPPAAPVQTVTESSADAHASGATFYYRPAGAGGTFTVTATTSDGETGILHVNFPGLSGGFTPTTGFNDTTSPYSRTYTWPAATGTETGSKTVTAYDNASNTSTGTFTITPDSAAPPLPVTTFPAADNYNAAGWNAGCGTNGFCGTSAADAASGLQLVALSVRRDSTGLYWDGSSFASATESFRTATGTSGWSLAFPASNFPADGTYTIRAQATDNVGNAGTTGTLTFTYDSTAPTGSLTAPAAGATVRQTITVSSDSADTGGTGVASAKFQRSPAGAGTWTDIGTDSDGTPWQVSFDTTSVTDGLYDLRVMTTDAAGNAFTSATVAGVRIDNGAPSGSVTSPGAGASVRQTITVSSDSSDGGSGVASARFERSPAGGGTWTEIGTDVDGAPWQVSFDTTGVAEGLYDLRVITTDAVGNAFTSAVTANVRVDNTNPSALFSFPAAAAAYAASSWDANCAGGGFCGTHSDSGSGVQQVEVSIRRVSSGLYWSAGSFSSATEVYTTASLAGSDWSLAFASGNFPGDGDYVVHARATDAAGNLEVGPSRTFTYDDSAPTAPSLSYGSFQNAVLAGGVVWYRPSAGSGQFDVTASSSDPHSGVTSYSFPAAASGWSVSGSGATRTYSHSGSPTDPSEPNNVTATNGAGLSSNPASFTVSPDSTAPSAQSISLNGGPFYATQSVAFTTGDGSDGESGLDTASRLLERADADLTNGSCGSFGSYGGSYTSPDTSVLSGKCYRYRFSIADRVGNRSAWVESGEAKVDTSAPATPELTVAEAPADPDQEAVGPVLYYRPGANGGTFTVSASASDGQSGIKHVSFPAVASVTGSGDDTLAPYEQSYTWTSLTSADTAAGVTATNSANSTSGAASFEVRPDSTPPTSAIQCNSGACAASWYSATVSISLSAVDAAAGVSEIRYTTDGSDPSPINGTVYAAPFDISSATTIRFRAYDKVGNEELVAQQLIRIDAVEPTTAASAANVSGSVHWNGSGTVFYRPGASGSFDLTATVTDAESGPQKASFPAIAGFGAGGDDTTIPYSSSYSYSGTPAEPGAQVVTGYDNVGRTSTATVNVTADSTAPTGHSATIAGGFYSTASVAVTLENGTDAGAGVDPASGVLERDEAPLDNGDGSCDAFPGSWTQMTLSGGADTTVQSGRCYRYRYTLSDRVGNASTSSASATAKVDTTAPAAPALAYGSFQNAVLTGGVVWYRPSAGTGQFAVTATATDAQSGIASYAFPAAASGWSRNVAGATATYSHAGSPADPAEPNDVIAQNNAGLVSGTTSFTVSADATGPTGQSATVSGGYFTSLSVPVTLGNGSDGESGLDATSGVVERESAALSAGSCGSFSGSWSTVTLSGGADTSVESGNCYRYRYTIFDRVGNASAPSAPSAAAKIDTAQPSVTQNDPGANLRGTVALTATAADPLSGVATIEIQRSPAGAGSWTSIGTDNSAPFSVDFNTTAVADGLYDLRAIATDGAGNSTTSTVVGNRRVDNTPPTATMNNPGNPLQGVITLSASASDAGSGTNNATFQYKQSSGSTWSSAGADSSSPYSISWDTMSVADGRYDFRVIVTDVAGNSTTSASVNNRQITNNPPIVSITAPGDYVNPADPDPYTITATASAEWPKTVDQVEFFRCTNASAGCATGSWVSLGVDLTAPYSASWALDAEGLRSLRAEVEDNTHSTNSDILDVTIDRTPPSSQTIGLNGGPWFAAASVGFTTGDGTDGGSGIDTASRLVERAEATLTNGACGTFGAFGGSFVSPDATVASGNCYRYRFSVADSAGNRSAWVESADAKVDTTAPSTPALTVAESPADPDQHVTGSTVYYRPGGGRAGSFAVSATTSDDQSGIQRVAFPAVAGMTGGGDDVTSPYQGTYDWTETTGTLGSQPVTSQNGAGISGAASSFTVTPDSTAPGGQTAALVGGPYFPSASVSFTTGNGSDAGSGLDASSIVVERAEAALVDGTCDPLGAFSGSYSSPDTSVVSGSCYRYRFSIADNVGNRSAWVETATAKIDTSAPAAPSLSLGSFTSASATGSTVYYRPSAGGGQFTVTAAATDGQSGVASYGFPSAATGWTVSGSGASRTYSHSGSPTDPAEPNDVTAQNNAGLTSSATSFDVTPDSTSPTGQSISAPAYATTTSVAFTTADGSDTGSGLATSTRLIRRAESTLSNDTCDPFGSPAGSFTSPDTTVTSGHCYLYELTIADKVGNVSTPVTVTVKVDTSAPAAPSLSYGSFSNAVLSGGVVFYRPSAAAGQFAVTASSSDTETGVASYTFPSAPAGWSRSVAGTTATYSHSGSPTDPAEPNDVTATNNAGLESGATSFTADADGSAPVSSIQCNDVACGGWYGGAVEIELAASDTGSGLAEIRYTTDGTDPTTTHGTVYSGEFDVSVATEIRYRGFDRLGNAEAVRSQQIMFDTSGPSVPALTLAEAPADPDQHVSGTTLYYRPGGGRSGTFSVLATTGDTQSGIERVNFPAITGMTGEGDDLVSPYEATYDWSSGVSASGANTVTARNNAGLQSTSSFTVTPDSGPPTGQSVDLAGGPYFTSLSVPLALDNGSDAASGLDLSSGVVERQSATLSAGNCVAWSGAWTPVALVGGADTTVLTNQCYRYRYLIADNLGNQSGPSALSAEAKVDATTPVTADDAPAGWESSDVVVTLGVNEIGSGVASTVYRVDSGSFQSGTSVSVPAPADHSNDGVHIVDYRSTDVAGNIEALRTTTVRIDTTLPTTVDDAAAGWRNSAVSVTLTPNDALSGIDSTAYRVDGGSFQNGTSVSVPAPADHTNDGVHTVEYRSTDVAGNAEALRTATVRVDTTLPTGSIDSPGNLAHVNGIVGVSALAADTASGVAAVEFRVRPNGSGSFSTLSTDTSAPFQASWDSTSAPEGNTELQILVTDNAANVLTAGIVTVVVDNPPAVSLVDPGANVAGTVNLEATSSPDTNLVVFERSPQGGGTWTVIATDLTAPFVAAFDSRAVSDTSYDFRAVATDLAGFTGSSNLRTARVDNTAPTVSVSDPANDAVVGGPNVHVGALASDLGSGVGSVRFEARAAAVGTFTEIGTDLAPPFDATWNASALAGSYELRAVATDAVGNPATSASILVTVDSIAPSVTLADVGAAVRGVVTLSAATQGAAVANVVFRWKPSSGDSWTEIGTDTAGPWNASFDTKNVPDGLYDLRAQAADSAGNVLAAHTRENVRVDNTAPSLQSAVPANGSSVARASAIVLFASEPVAAVRGATLDGAATTPEIAGSRITFATGSLGLGRHELAGSLEDAVGNAATFQIAFVVKVQAQAALVLSVGKPRSSVRGKQQIFVVQITLSKPAKVETTLLSPTGRRVRATRRQLPAGRNQVKIAVPRDSLPPGRYTIVVRATSADGTEVVKRVRVMVKGAQHTKQQSPSPAPRGALVPTPQAEGPPPPPQPARRPVEPGTKRPDPTPRPGSKPDDEAGANTLEAASRLVKSKDRHNLGLGIFLVVMGLAVAYLLKMELRRLVAGPRRFGG